MTNKEQLEEIKKKYFMHENYVGKVTISHHVLEWLIEQVERAQELEEKNRKLDFAIGSYSLQVSEISRMIEREVQGMKKLSNRMVKGESE